MSSQTAAALLTAFDEPLNVAVIGASGGIGNALVTLLAATPNVGQVYAFSRSSGEFDQANVTCAHLDLQDETTIAAGADLAAADTPLDLIIVATGVLHNDTGLQPEKNLSALDPERLAEVFAINTIGPALIAKHFLPRLRRDRKTVFAALSARVGSISDNRLGGWYAYRASKAALNMLLRTAAIETARRYKQAVILGLHPGTVDTGLSKPFQSHVADEKLFSPAFAASCLLNVINGCKAEDSGKVFAWDGSEIPY